MDRRHKLQQDRHPRTQRHTGGELLARRVCTAQGAEHEAVVAQRLRHTLSI